MVAHGTIAFDTLTTSDQKKTSTEKSLDTSYIYNGSAKVWFESETLTSNATATDEDSFNISTFTDTDGGQLTPAYTSNFSNTGYSSVSVNGTSSTIIPLTKYNASTSGETILMYKEDTNAYTDCGMCATYMGELA